MTAKLTDAQREVALQKAREIPGFLWSEGCGFESGVVEAELLDYVAAVLAALPKPEPHCWVVEDGNGTNVLFYGKRPGGFDHWPRTKVIALYAEAPIQSAPTGFDAEFLAKRLGRVARLTGVNIPDHFTHEQVAEAAGTILGQIASALEAEPIQSAQGWQPIETAPKDKDVLLFCTCRGVVRGRWEDDKYAKSPRPYWKNDRERTYGTRETRADQPTHWMPLPAAPGTNPAPQPAALADDVVRDAELSRLSDLCDKWNAECDDYRQENIRLQSELIKHMCNSERYTWLRTHGLQRAWVSLGTDCDGENYAQFKCEFKVPEPPNLPYEDDEGLEWSDNDFDTAIDAAIAAAKGEK